MTQRERELETMLNEYQTLSDYDHIRELLAAEREGRLDIRPCCIGDTMYGIRNHSGVYKVQIGTVSEMNYTKNIDGGMRLVIVIKHVCRGLYGDKVFSTYTEAVAALAEKEGV